MLVYSQLLLQHWSIEGYLIICCLWSMNSKDLRNCLHRILCRRGLWVVLFGIFWIFLFRIVRTTPSFLLCRILGEHHHRCLCLPRREYLQYLCLQCSQIFCAKVAWLASWCNLVKSLREDLWLLRHPCWGLSYKNLIFSNFDLTTFGRVRIQK